MNYIVIEEKFSRSTEFAAFAARFEIECGEIVEETKNGEFILEMEIEGPEATAFIAAYRATF